MGVLEAHGGNIKSFFFVVTSIFEKCYFTNGCHKKCQKNIFFYQNWKEDIYLTSVMCHLKRDIWLRSGGEGELVQGNIRVVFNEIGFETERTTDSLQSRDKLTKYSSQIHLLNNLGPLLHAGHANFRKGSLRRRCLSIFQQVLNFIRGKRTKLRVNSPILRENFFKKS